MRKRQALPHPAPKGRVREAGLHFAPEPLALSDTYRHGLRVPCSRGGAARCVSKPMANISVNPQTQVQSCMP